MPMAPDPQGQPELPVWYEPGRVVLQLDVTALLETGEHPLARVKQAVAGSAPGQIVELHSHFAPVPLLDVFTSAGMRVWCGQEGTLFRTFIARP